MIFFFMPTTTAGTIYDSVTLIYLNLMKWVRIYFVYKGGKSNRSGGWGSWQRADGESFCYGGEGAPVSTQVNYFDLKTVKREYFYWYFPLK